MLGLYTYYYFIGIGGIGMSALARYFNFKGAKVFGYDKTPSNLTQTLQDEGIEICFSDSVDDIPEEIIKNKEMSLIIYTPAIPESHEGYTFLLKNSFNIVKRAKVLGSLCNNQNGIAISGTHGKTSVTTFTTQIMYNSEKGCSAFLGGISKNFKSNFVYSDFSKNVIVEADEYDRSFHNLFPTTALVTSIDEDHLEIYGNHQNIFESFYKFLGQIKQNGICIHKSNVPIEPIRSFLESKEISIFTYSLDDSNASFYASNIVVLQNSYTFNLHTPKEIIENIQIYIPGLINIENVIAASAIALCNGVTAAELKNALIKLQGVERRLDVKYKDSNTLYIDDYAHHPEELKACINSIKHMCKGRKISGIFQPHLFSRTKDFANEFAESLSLLDEVILLDIYPARELPIEGVSSEIIYKNITCNSKILCKKEELMDVVQTKQFDVLLTMGAGDIDRFINPICQILENRK